MDHHDLPAELAHWEQQLTARPTPSPRPDLRDRILTAVRDRLTESALNGPAEPAAIPTPDAPPAHDAPTESGYWRPSSPSSAPAARPWGIATAGIAAAVVFALNLSLVAGLQTGQNGRYAGATASAAERFAVRRDLLAAFATPHRAAGENQPASGN